MPAINRQIPTQDSIFDGTNTRFLDAKHLLGIPIQTFGKLALDWGLFQFVSVKARICTPNPQFLVLVVAILGMLTTVATSSAQQVPPQKRAAIDSLTAKSTFEINTAGLTQDELDAGWISLFDGNTLFGWKPESKANWRVQDGEIQVSQGERGLLRTTSQFDDYTLKLKFKAPRGTNSGVFLRTSPKPRKPGEGGDCYEVNIAMPEQSKFTTGSLVNRLNLTENSSIVDLDEGWHAMTMCVDGGTVNTWVDDKPMLQYTDSKPLGRGFIGLQLNSGEVAFKDIYLQPRGQETIFNGEDLSGWKTDLKLESRFEVTDNQELQIFSGSGQIESEKTYGDFIFSTKCQTNAVGLNSGVFFRCIVGDKMNGYESQIQNLYKDDDPTKPADCGTGGIFRRTVARQVNAEDKSWFTKTIVATGPHIAVWVNGYQVTDWTDQRKPNKNPRKGLRVEPGTIIFQGHDPTTDILLKDIKAKEMSARNR